MNSKVREISKNLSYSFSVKVFSTVISLIMVLIMPKWLGLNQYSYWQLYIFYVSFVGVLGLGWSDGIYLKLGGEKYEQLNRPLLRSQFWMLLILEVFFLIVLFCLTSFFVTDYDKYFILNVTFASGIFLILRSLFFYVLEATNKIKEFALINFIDRALYIGLTLVTLSLGVTSYKPIILADMLSKMFTLAVTIYFCKDLVFGKLETLTNAFKDALTNVSVGVKLLIANIASTLVIGVVRWGIEREWDIEVFGKVSFTLSLTSILLLFVNSAGTVMFPLLRQTSPDKLPFIYRQVRSFITLPMFLLLAFYYPLSLILFAWLPQYKDSVYFLAIILPVCIYESRMALLVSSYLKALRKEKIILKVNIVTLVISMLATFVLVSWFQNLYAVVFLIFILLVFRCILAEILLSHYLKININIDVLIEMTLTIAFILTNWLIGGLEGQLLFVSLLFIYFLKKKNTLIELSDILKNLVSKKNKSKGF